MEKPLISFILTYYNLPVNMLCQCIDSVMALSLTPEEREIIVVDDGSKDSPVNSLMKYGDDITYIRQRNQGLSEARNTGIQMAAGQYLQFVDDVLLREFYLSDVFLAAPAVLGLRFGALVHRVAFKEHLNLLFLLLGMFFLSHS